MVEGMVDAQIGGSVAVCDWSVSANELDPDFWITSGDFTQCRTLGSGINRLGPNLVGPIDRFMYALWKLCPTRVNAVMVKR